MNLLLMKSFLEFIALLHLLSLFNGTHLLNFVFESAEICLMLAYALIQISRRVRRLKKKKKIKTNERKKRKRKLTKIKRKKQLSVNTLISFKRKTRL